MSDLKFRQHCSSKGMDRSKLGGRNMNLDYAETYLKENEKSFLQEEKAGLVCMMSKGSMF